MSEESLKDCFFELIQIVTNPSLWNALLDEERDQISKILQKIK
jgi:hypothetical protein